MSISSYIYIYIYICTDLCGRAVAALSGICSVHCHLALLHLKILLGLLLVSKPPTTTQYKPQSNFSAKGLRLIKLSTIQVSIRFMTADELLKLKEIPKDGNTILLKDVDYIHILKATSYLTSMTSNQDCLPITRLAYLVSGQAR